MYNFCVNVGPELPYNIPDQDFPEIYVYSDLKDTFSMIFMTVNEKEIIAYKKNVKTVSTVSDDIDITVAKGVIEWIYQPLSSATFHFEPAQNENKIYSAAIKLVQRM